MSELQTIGFKNGTDKSGANHGTHIFNNKSLLDNYTRYFEPLRLLPINILELGILDGSSLRTWEEYFPNAKIAALDIDPTRSVHASNRSKVYIGSQDDKMIIDQINQDFPDGFDIILDDASHINELTIASFNLLFDHVKPGAMYIIEDTCCAYGFDEFPNFTNDVNTWPGMKYNRPDVKFNNRRSQFDEFISLKLRDLDMKTGDIYAMHFYSETLIIEKIK